MNYANMVSGTFLARPNRFIAYVDIAGRPKSGCSPAALGKSRPSGRRPFTAIPGLIFPFLGTESSGFWRSKA